MNEKDKLNPESWRSDEELCCVHDLVSRSAARTPDAPFLIAPKRTYSYDEIERRSTQVARWIRALGIRPGERVAVLATNTAEYVTAYYAMSKAGAVSVPINNAVDAPGLRYVLENSGANVLLVEKRFLFLAEEVAAAWKTERDQAPVLFVCVLSSLPEKNTLLDGGLPQTDGSTQAIGTLSPQTVSKSWDSAWRQPSSDNLNPTSNKTTNGPSSDPASIIYTSGSTGRPRGATLSHKNILANTESIVSYLSLQPSDRIMVILPFYYVYGKSLLNTHASVGGAAIIGTDLYFPSSVVKRMHKDAATGFAGVPSTFLVLLDRSKLAAETPPSLRYLTQAGGPMSPALTERVLDELAGTSLFIMYGATEASARLSYLPPEELPRRLGSIGKAIPGVTLRVLDERGDEVGTGVSGELAAAGDNIMLGYWEDPDETGKVLRNGELFPGDLARKDDDGFLYIVGRKKEMIKSGAHRVSPQEIEEVIVSHPEVSEAAVLGVPDELLGETILAFVVCTDEGPEAAGLIEWLAERLPEFKVPRRIEFREDLPKNESGKVQKRQLLPAEDKPSDQPS